MSLIERILRRVKVTPSGCWEWTGAMSQSGYRGVFYPHIKLRGRNWRLNRLMLILHRGLTDVPRHDTESWSDWLDRCRTHYNGVESSHACDNARCIHPLHLDWKTHHENIAEQVDRCLKN